MTAEGKSCRSRPTGAERLTLAAATQRHVPAWQPLEGAHPSGNAHVKL